MKIEKLSEAKPRISIICCIAKNRGIGKENKLLFDIPADLQHFKKITLGHPVIMGYNTYKSIGRPLPKRLNIILSPDNIEVDGCSVVKSIPEAISLASEDDQEEIFFIGGGMVYKQAIEFADRLYLTIVDEEPEADTFFPEYDKFSKIVSEESEKSAGYKCKYVVLQK